jgi:uncharacterized protein (TIGR02722 family)
MIANRSFATGVGTALACLVLFGGIAATSCKPQYTRDTEKEDLDEAAMSTRLDRKDLNRLYDNVIDNLMGSSIVSQWEREAARGDAPVVAAFPMRNETQQDVQLDVVLRKFEKDLVNKSAAEVVSHEDQPELIAEVKRQQSDAYDPKRLSKYGRQLGAQYFVTGKVYGVREQVDKEKRQQYFMFVQVLNVETGAIKFQDEAKVTKGYVR